MDLKAIIQHAEQMQSRAHLNERMLDIYSGNLNQYVKRAISEELSPNSYKIASKRIPSINMLEKITDKLSKVYNETPERIVTDPKDQQIINQYSESIDIQTTMSNAEVLLNLNKNFALEPYINDQGLMSVRILAPHEFAVYSDDIVNPKNPTHFIKFMGSRVKGKNTVNVYWVYSSELFVEVDSELTVTDQKENPYGVIPFVYCTSDKFSLQPKPDEDSFENTILIPKLLTDLNFAAQFQSHSIMYGIDVDSKNLQGGPDAFWSVKSEEGSDKKPQLGVLSPSVDVDKVLSLVSFTITQWLDSKSIKPTTGNIGSNNPEAAISKIIDEADASEIIKSNKSILTKSEQALWTLIGVVHNTYTIAASDLLKIKTGVSNPIHVSIVWPKAQVLISPQEERAALEFKLKNKLISYDRALRQANPDLSDDEIEKLKQEIAEETRNE